MSQDDQHVIKEKRTDSSEREGLLRSISKSQRRVCPLLLRVPAGVKGGNGHEP